MISPRFNLLKIRWQRRFEPKDRAVKVIGYDTETVDGLCTLLCDKTDHVNPKSFETVIDFLTDYKRRGRLGFFYNMKYDFQAILKWLPPDYWVDLRETGKCAFGDWELFYIPKKMFWIRRVYAKNKSRVFKFFDISQFYNKTSLDKASQKYLGESKLDHGFDITKLTPEICEDPKMIEYCKDDAYKCERLAELFISTCQGMNLYPTNFCSPASISKRFFEQRADIPHINRLSKMHPEILHMVWEATNGAFISVFKRGYFKRVYEYDINSAYPFDMSELPDIRDGRFFTKRDEPPKDAQMGWLKCLVKIWPEHKTFYHPPFVMQRPGLSNYFPCGEFPVYITLKEFRSYRRDFDIKPVSGVYWVADNEPRYPFADVIHHLYNERLKTADPLINYFLKICLNGYFGKTIEKHKILDPDHDDFGFWETGQHFNPMYGSYILAGCRVKVYELLRRLDPAHIIGCATDAVFTSQKIAGIGKTSELGAWSPARSGEMLMVGCGVYSIKTSKGVKSKIRGFHTTQDDLFKMFAENRGKKSVSLVVNQNVSFPTALIQNRPQDMNKIIKGQKRIDINFDTKRLWLGSFLNAGEFLEKQVDSQPILYGM